MRTLLAVAVAGGLSMLPIVFAQPSQARVTRIEISKVEPAFGGRRFGAIGSYERLVGRAYGEVDPKHPANAIVQDIGLAANTVNGRVQYVTDIDILRPADRSKGNSILFFNSSIAATRAVWPRSMPTCPLDFPRVSPTTTPSGWRAMAS
jgi:hypothetical protein